MQTIIFLVEQTTKLQGWSDREASYYTGIIGAFTTEELALAFIAKAPTEHSCSEQEYTATYTYNVQSWTLKDEL